jgi:signal transduction histidine kinase
MSGMNDVQEVAVLRVGRSADEIPLTDWAVSRLLNSCCRFDADWPTTLAEDPCLARWIAARMPREAKLCDISACIDRIARQNPIGFFASSITTVPISGEVWQSFQRWWRQEAAAARLVREILDTRATDTRATETGALIPVLCQLIGPSLPPAAVHAGTRPVEWITSDDADHEIVRATEKVRGRLREDSQLVRRCLPNDQFASVERVLNPLHRLLPELLRKLAELEKLRARFDEQLEREKLLSMKELAYGASHEINNPLANISSRAQVLLREESDPERRRSLATINSQAFRAHEMIADMMLFAKPPALTLSRLDPRQFLDAVVAEVSRELPPSIELLREDAETIPSTMVADPVQLTVAIHAICANAVEAMEGQGQLRIRLRQAPVVWQLEQPMAEIEIQDDGPGISPEVRRHLFDPFYSGREAGRGLGFGLSKAWRIIQLHGGQILVDSQAGEGATFTVCLPMERTADADENPSR